LAMMGRRSDQGGLFGAQQHYLDWVGRESFYGLLAAHGRQLFRDEEFAGLYCAETGRPSVRPGLLCLALLLQSHDRVSDAEAKQRADLDLRWKVALGIDRDERPFAKSTRQLFRAQLVIQEQAQSLFRRSLEVARAQGWVKGGPLRAALDTTISFGRGAVEDTYNLIVQGMQELCRVLAAVAGEEPAAWAQARDLGRYCAPSIKGAVELDWDEAPAGEALLTAIIAAGERALAWAREVRSGWGPGSPEDRRIAAAAALLTQLLWPDVEPTDRGYRVKPGTAEGRVPSVHDPEQRHGHKSHGRSFTGHQAAVAVDPESQLITAGEVIPANASDGERAAALVASSEANRGSAVEPVIGDTA